MGNNGLKQNEGLEEEVFRDILDEADEKGDGVIDFEEFSNMMQKLVIASPANVGAPPGNNVGAAVNAMGAKPREGPRKKE